MNIQQYEYLLSDAYKGVNAVHNVAFVIRSDLKRSYRNSLVLANRSYA
jgi:hypothetical protein